MTNSNITNFWHLIHVEKSPSTNSELRDLIMADKAGAGDVLWADSQTQGRGRFDRQWISPAGNISISFAVDLGNQSGKSYQLNLVAGLSVLKTLKKLSVNGVSLKWPNDVLVNGKKVCGLLSEIISEKNTAIIGVGINLNSTAFDFPGDLQNSLTTVYDSLLIKLDIKLVVNDLLGQLASDIQIYQKNGFEAIRNEFKNELAWQNKTVTVTESSTSFEGVQHDIDADGFLVIKMSDGNLRTVLAGDVRLANEI